MPNKSYLKAGKILHIIFAEPNLIIFLNKNLDLMLTKTQISY